MEQKRTCFVIMGYGLKTDFETGRQFDLDKTYENIIKPVFEELGIICFRASDIKHSGVIDVPMYDAILKSDIVVADISTLNPNAIYELGVRHALRPFSTIVISESGMRYPFDLTHTVIRKYKHLGEDIGVSEARRFKEELSELVLEIIDKHDIDSPVYTHIPNLKQPEFSIEEVEKLRTVTESDETLATLLKLGDTLISEEKFQQAIKTFEVARSMEPNEPYIIQRLALATYKNYKGKDIVSLQKAEELLQSLNPSISNDPETLGLLGAINKRMFTFSGNQELLNKAIDYYNRGFIIQKSYYNGINLAFLYLLKAKEENEDNQRNADVILAKRTRTATKDICLKFMEMDDFDTLPDKVWIVLTLAEVEYLDGTSETYKQYVSLAMEKGASQFQLSSFHEQIAKIESIRNQIKLR